MSPPRSPAPVDSIVYTRAATVEPTDPWPDLTADERAGLEARVASQRKSKHASSWVKAGAMMELLSQMAARQRLDWRRLASTVHCPRRVDVLTHDRV